MGQTIVQVDAFTAERFRGNPAAVCVLEEERSVEWMQNVALEMSVSETAFLRERRDGYSLRWFTPSREVELCGHATLASAHVLWEGGHLAHYEEARFHTLSGELGAARFGDWIELDFPIEAPEPTDAPPALLEGLRLKPRYVGRNRFDYLVEVDSPEQVQQLRPNLGLLSLVDMRGVIVTSRTENGDHDFVSRYFAPGYGIDEDPVTGSAHCCLAPYWAERLGSAELTGYQASARGGIVRVRVAQDRVMIGGQAVTVMRGELVEDDRTEPQ